MSDYNFYFIKICRKCWEKNIQNSLKIENKITSCPTCGKTDNYLFANPNDLKNVVRDVWNGRGKPRKNANVNLSHHKDEKRLDDCFAINEYEEQMWNKMIETQRYKVNEIYTKDCERYVYTVQPSYNTNIWFNKPSINISQCPNDEITGIPSTQKANENTKKEENAKSYFCWFCRVTIVSEKKVEEHLIGRTHKAMYSADKMRRWYFKMPPIDYNIKLCSHYEECGLHKGKTRKLTLQSSNQYDERNYPSRARSSTSCSISKPNGLCQMTSCCHVENCYQPHIDDELEEMQARIKFRDAICNYQNIVEKENEDYKINIISTWPSDVTLILPRLPSQMEFYRENKMGKILIKLLISNPKIYFKSVYLRDNESRPFFKLFVCETSQSISKPRQMLKTDSKSPRVIFGLEFTPQYISTYIQNLEFEFQLDGTTIFCQKMVRVDFGKENNLKLLERQWARFGAVIHCDKHPGNIVTLNGSNESIGVLSEYDLGQIFRVQSNYDWYLTKVKNWNYIHWMRDMMLLEELEQRRLLLELETESNVLITNSSESPFGGISFAQNGCLYGIVNFEKFETQDQDLRKALELLCKSIDMVYLVKDNVFYECEIINLFKHNTETRTKDGFRVNLSEKIVQLLEVKHGDCLENISFVFQFNRLRFDRLHSSLNLIPNCDKLTYSPLPCPAFTRLPYGKPANTVIFNSDLKLTRQQMRLPYLVLREIDPKEAPLPFVLNGAFGTGKSLVVAETVKNILRHFTGKKIRILICTRSYSAAEVFGQIFGTINDKFKVIYASYRHNKPGFKKEPWDIFTDEYNDDFFDSTKIFVTTLDNIIEAFESYRYKFDDEPMFHYIFVDEAAQVLEVEAITVYQFGNRSTKFVFTGDVFQTRPDIFFDKLKNFSIPIVTRLHKLYNNNCDYEICLTDVYRSHKDIVGFLSKAIYNTELTSCLTHIPHFVTQMQKHMGFIDYQKYFNQKIVAQFDNKLGTYCNISEVKFIRCSVVNYIKISKLTDYKRILVCTPFYGQIQIIRQELKKETVFDLKNVEVMLPSAIQGREFDAVFISTVLTGNIDDNNSNASIHTFHSSKNMVNLVFSRSKYYVEVVGDRNSLVNQKTEKQWKIFMDLAVSI